eukprot:CAMPEP_0202469664 /NCGR_PEP_ID=MMETSP1360-20130828/79178_1 /ASSEMBLY_ACC=CAM_ASM_000848 /TAXON_ID=515479 /ORGANISM="Licmophora paradoxa, Strain CCMP2313" /LENGTH=106 /DNA_ID=CAMNT_0049095077 /DNA_START=278 /DNA_END=598 /DNA_ORIENTATION=-
MVDISDTLSNTWLLGIPLIASTLIALLVALPYIWRPYQEAVVITALVALFCLEALLPLLIFIGTYLLLTGQLEIYSGVALLALVWFLITAATHWISCTIFQQMGHG